MIDTDSSLSNIHFIRGDNMMEFISSIYTYPYIKALFHLPRWWVYYNKPDRKSELIGSCQEGDTSKFPACPLPLRYEARFFYFNSIYTFLILFNTFFLSSSCGVNKYSHAIKSTFNWLIEEMINNNDIPWCTCDA